MLSPRWSKVLRDLQMNKLRTSLVVLSIAVGVFAVGAIASSWMILSREMIASYTQANPASITLAAEPFDAELLQVIRGIRTVQAAEGRRTISVQLKVGPEEWQQLTLFAIPDFEAIQVNQIRPEQGAWPPGDREMLIERAALGLTAAQVGDQVVLKTSDNKLRTMQITGLAHDVIQFPAPLAGQAYGYITFDTLEWLGQPRTFNEIHILAAGDTLDVEHLQAVAEEVRSKVEKSGRTVFSVTIPPPDQHPADASIQPILLVLAVLGVMSLLLSGFLVTNTIGALLTQQIRQIGVMKAIGARTRQLMGIYLSTVLIFGLLALVIAIPLGALGARLFTAFVANLINFDITTFSIPPLVLIGEVAVGLLVPLVVALYPVFRGTRITIREAISGTGMSAGGPRKQRWWSPIKLLLQMMQPLIAALPLSRPFLLSLRNTFRRKGRLVLTLATLTLGGAIFISVLSVQASLYRTLDDALRYWKYDVEIFFPRSYRIDHIQRTALSVPGVTAAESWGNIGTRRLRADGSESDRITMYAPPATTTLLQPTIFEGRWLLAEDENAVVVNTEVLRADPDIAVGDDLTLMIEGRETVWQVVGIVQGVVTGPIMYVNYPYFTEVVRDIQRASNVRIVTERHDAAFQSQVMKAVQARFEAANLRVGGAQTVSEIRERVEFQFNIIVVCLLIMSVLLAIVGGLGLMGTMSINVLERTREIGVMRAIGASNGAVLRVVIGEGFVIGMLGWATAVLVALPMSQALSAAVGNAFVRAPLNYTFAPSGVVLWLVIISVLAPLSSFIPAWNASRLSVRAVLAYE